MPNEPLCTKRAQENSAVAELARFLIHDNHELRAQVLNIAADDLYRNSYKESIPEYRQRVVQRLKQMASKEMIRVMDYKE